MPHVSMAFRMLWTNLLRSSSGAASTYVAAQTCACGRGPWCTPSLHVEWCSAKWVCSCQHEDKSSAVSRNPSGVIETIWRNPPHSISLTWTDATTEEKRSPWEHSNNILDARSHLHSSSEDKVKVKKWWDKFKKHLKYTKVCFLFWWKMFESHEEMS